MKKRGRQTGTVNLVCGTCYNKIPDEICTACFCRVCYTALEEYCDCVRDD